VKQKQNHHNERTSQGAGEQLAHFVIIFLIIGMWYGVKMLLSAF
jgi:hypothetical protein